METKNELRKKSNIFVIFSYLYVILPILIFVLTWCNAITLTLGLILIFCGTVFVIKNSTKLWFPNSAKEWVTIALLFVISIFWVYLSGIGAFVFQNPDHNCRNFIFELLVTKNSPIIINQGSIAYLFTYYLAFWLPSALIAKIFGSNIQLGYYLQFCWATIGVFLVFYYILAFFKNKNILPIIIFIFFSGLDFLGAKFVGYPINLVSHLEWWFPNYQFSSFTTQLFWVFNQAIPTWLITLIILKEENNKNILFLYSVLFLFATFPAIGMFPIVLYCLYKNYFINIQNKYLSFENIKGFFKSILSFQNIFSALFIVLISFVYLSENISSTQKSVSTFDIFELLKFLCYFFLLEVGVYLLLIYKFCKKEPLFYISTLSFLIYPFVIIGTSNDFCMRATIPALIVLYLLVAKTLFSSEILKYKKIFIILIICLLFGAITPIHEISRTIEYTGLGMKKIKPTSEIQSNFFSYVDGNFFYKYFGRNK